MRRFTCRAVFLSFLLLTLGCHKTSPLAPETAAPVTTPSDPSGTDVGNGGDHVRGIFRRMGKAVLRYLTENEAGRKLVAKYGLNLGELEQTLQINRLRVVKGPLDDNSGSDVDARGEFRIIKLVRGYWLEHFELERKVYYLVFHEMLRSCGINDDGYLISEALIEFPREYQIVTRSSSAPFVAPDDLTGPFSFLNASFAGLGCKANSDEVEISYSAEANVLNMAFTSLALFVQASDPLRFRRANCSIAIPLTAPRGEIIHITQIDVSGEMSLPKGAAVLAFAKAFTTGRWNDQGAVKTYSAEEDSLSGRFQIRAAGPTITSCGGSGLFRLSIEARALHLQPEPLTFRIDRVSAFLTKEPCRGDD